MSETNYITFTVSQMEEYVNNETIHALGELMICDYYAPSLDGDRWYKNNKEKRAFFEKITD